MSFVCKLSEKKHRDRECRFRIDGVKLLCEAIECGVDIESLLVMKSAENKILSRLEKYDTLPEIKMLSDGVFEKITEEKSPEGVICVAKHIDKFHKIATINNNGIIVAGGTPALDDAESVFALESVRDPGNLGTVIRTAAAFGVDCLLISEDCADIYNPRTVRAAMGALFRQKIVRVDNMANAIESLSLRGRHTYAATLGKNAELLGKCDLKNTDCIVVGNEGHGLSDNVIKACEKKILIPMADGTESLNAAIASSICLWEQFGRKL